MYQTQFSSGLKVLYCKTRLIFHVRSDLIARPAKRVYVRADIACHYSKSKLYLRQRLPPRHGQKHKSTSNIEIGKFDRKAICVHSLGSCQNPQIQNQVNTNFGAYEFCTFYNSLVLRIFYMEGQNPTIVILLNSFPTMLVVHQLYNILF